MIRSSQSKKVNGNFFRLSLASLDGNFSQIQQNRNCFPIAVIMLTIWVIVSSFGPGRVFEKLEQFQDMYHIASMAQENFQQYQGAFNEQVSATEQENSIFSLPSFGEEPPKNRLSPFTRAALANVSTLLVLFVFFAIMVKISKQKVVWTDNVIVLASSSFPLLIGMVVSYIFFSIAEASGEGGSPATWYALALAVLLAAVISTLISLYVNVQALLRISARKRYLTTLLAFFIANGTFTLVSRSLMN